MPWEIRRNYGGCSGYAVVKKPDGEVEGCHSTVAAAESQMRALYASEGEMGGPGVKMVKQSEHEMLYNQLTPEEKAFHDALVSIAEQYGPFDLGTSSIWVGYEPASENEDADIGVKCSNCTFFMHESNGCKLLSYQVEPEGKCRLAAIPDGYVNPNNDTDMDDDMDDMDKDVITSEDTPNKNPMGISASSTYYKMDKAMTLDELDLRPTETMANNAKRGLELRRQFGRGGTAVGVARARDLANRKELSPETVGRMYSFFSRHEVDKKGKDFNNPDRPSNGKIAWLLWGGDSGFAWARSKWGAIQRIRAQKSENAVWKDSALSLEKFIEIPE